MRFLSLFFSISYNVIGDYMKITTMEQLNKVQTTEFSVILAKSHGCGVCEITKVQLDSLLPKYNLKIHEVYIDDLPEFRGEHLVFTVPTVLIFSNGKEMLRESRFIDLNKIERIIKLNQN